MNHFQYRDGILHAEDVPIPEIAASVGTPFYCYSSATLTRHYRVFTDALKGLDTMVCFSAKANGNLAVLKLLGDLGAGCDVVSGGEFKRALAAGIPAEKIVFSGVGKTEEELAFAVENGVGQINVESESELNHLNAISVALGKRTPIALRVNPDVHAETHDKISTGRKEDKFGVDWDDAPKLYAAANNMPGLDVRGVAVHIGSQITNLAPFEAAFAKVAGLVADLRDLGIDIRTVDLGGGLGVPYKRDNDTPPSPEEYGQVVRRTVGDLGCKILFEPGRVIAANAGILVTKVIYLKHGETKEFVIVDAAMNDLIRPAMYDAHHDVLPVNEPKAGASVTNMDIVGPICETGDRFVRDTRLSLPNEGDLIAFMAAGAYGAVMSSTYNARPLIPEVLVKGAEFAVVRRRPPVEDLWALESLPDWATENSEV